MSDEKNHKTLEFKEDLALSKIRLSAIFFFFFNLCASSTLIPTTTYQKTLPKFLEGVYGTVEEEERRS